MIQVDWGNAEETFLVMRFSKVWTTEEYEAAILLARKYILSKLYTVDVIVDMRFYSAGTRQINRGDDPDR